MATIAIPKPDADGLLGKAIKHSTEVAKITAGSFVCILGASLSSLGLILMKKHFIEEDIKQYSLSKEVDAQIDNTISSKGSPRDTSIKQLKKKTRSFHVGSDGKPYFARFTYVFGLSLYIAGQLCFLLALSLIDQVLWGVLSLFSLVTNAWLSELVLDERFTLHDFVSTCLIVLGTIVVAASKPASSSSYTIDELLALFVAPTFIVYISSIGVLLLYRLVVVLYRLKRGLPSDGLTWVLLAAVTGSFSVLLGKCTTDLINSALDAKGSGKNHNFSSPSTYVMLVLFILTALASLHSTSMALAHGDALVIVPWLTVCNTGLVIFGGMFYFQDFAMFQDPPRAVMFVFGLLLSGGAAVLLQQGHPDYEHLGRIDPALLSLENASKLKRSRFWNQRFSTWCNSLCCNTKGRVPWTRGDSTVCAPSETTPLV